VPLTIPRRFNGPPSSGNGGWSAGAFAVHAGLPVGATVRLRVPPPLETPLRVSGAADGVELRDGDRVVAVAGPPSQDRADVPPVDPVTAAEASARYPGLVRHPFPTCFVCGPDRPPGDGLRIFPGRLDAGDVAAPWTPDPSVSGPDGTVDVPVTWAALDCVGGWAGDLEERLMVLARMTARLDALPVIGEEHLLVGKARGNDGRKTWTSSTMYDADGRVVGTAEHLWIAVDPRAFD